MNTVTLITLFTSSFNVGLITASCEDDGCPDLLTDGYSITQLAQSRTFLAFGQKDQAEDIDNICYTLELLYGTTYIGYSSTVFNNGSTSLLAYIVSEVTPGQLLVTAPVGIASEYSIGATSSGVRVLYTCFTCGADLNQYAVGISSNYGAISQGTLDDAKKVIASQGLAPDDYVILKMSRPPQCYYSKQCHYSNRVPSCPLRPQPFFVCRYFGYWC